MIHTLLAINADLASSIAFRYACRLAKAIDMRLQPIHVEAAENEKYPPGSGWVRSTWEEGLLQSARESITQLINTEKAGCTPLDTPLVRIGEREDELLGEIRKSACDLLLEGILENFDTQVFHHRIRSKLYRQADCPIILVKNLADPGRVALLIQAAEDVAPVVSTFVKLFDPAGTTTVDVCYCKYTTNDRAPSMTNVTDASQPEEAEGRRLIEAAIDHLATNGWTPEASWIIHDRPQQIGANLGAYGLVGTHLPQSPHQRDLTIDLLSRVSSATLLVK